MKNYIVVSTCDRLARQVLLAIRCMSKDGNGKVVVIGNKKIRNLQWTSLCSESHVISFERSADEAFVETVNAVADNMPQAVLIPTDCDAARVISRNKEKLQLRCISIPDSITLETLDNKWSFYDFCIQNEICVPETVFIGAKANLNFKSIADQLGLPFILKPVNQAGSNGVHVVRSEAYYNNAIRDDSAYKFDALIAQRYIAGIDLCFNLLANNGKITAFSIQQRVGSEIRFISNPLLESMGYELARASLYSGVMCIDARVEEETGRIFLLESNPRFWASLCASVWCGLNFVEEIIKPTFFHEAPYKLISGKYQERHPLYRPSSWLALLIDSSGQGRIFRAMMSDLPTLWHIVYSLPSTLLNYMARRLLH